MDRLILSVNDAAQILLQIAKLFRIGLGDGFRWDARHLGDDLLHLFHTNDFLTARFRQQHLGGTNLVDHVDRLVRQLAVVDVLRRQFDGGFDRIAGVTNLVIFLEIGLQPFEDFHRIGNRRLRHIDLLEAADQCAILFEILPVFLVGGGPHAAQGAGLQRRFQQVRRIHRAATGGAGADNSVNLVNEQDSVFQAFQFLDDRFQTLLEIAAIAGAGDQRAHIERIDHGIGQHLRHFVLHDLACETFGDRRFADAGVADEQRIVFLAAAENLDRAFHLGIAADQRIDAALLRLFVQVDAIGLQRLGPLFDGFVAILLLIRTADGFGRAHARTLGDAVADIAHRVQPRHVLFLKEIDGVAFTLRKQRDKDIGARHLIPAGILDVQHRALHHALETGGGLRVLPILDHQSHQFLIDIAQQGLAQRLAIGIAGLHHLSGIGIIDQRQKKMFERRILVMAVGRQLYGAVEGLLKTARQGWHLAATPSPWCIVKDVDGGAKIQSPAPPLFPRLRR